ncbi:MAG TPA: hypothetical protein VHT24_05765 [Pseudacidobacterium sp.]|nr:hypothetical protein [Pseudacidobacterium sp.]
MTKAERQRRWARRARQNMNRFFLQALVATLILTSSMAWAEKQSEFSADMVITQSTGETRIEKLYVGKGRARLDRIAQEGQTNRISSLVMDFDHQLLYLLAPRDKMYLKILGSEGTLLYKGAHLFRPQSPDTACSDWVPEADSRGVTLRCKQSGQDTIAGRVGQRWEAIATNGAHGSLWYDPDLNFVVKVSWVSKEGVQLGYELQNIKVASQQSDLFDIPIGYRQFTFNRLFDVLTKLGQ